MSIREAIRRVQRDPSRELGQSRRPEGYRGGTVLAAVRMSFSILSKPPLNQPHDITAPYYFVRHTLRVIGPTPTTIATAVQSASSSNFDFPQFPSDFESGSSGYSAKREIDAWAIMAVYPKWTLVFATQDVAGHWWIVPLPLRRLIVSLPLVDTLPLDVNYEHILAQEGTGYALPRDPAITDPASRAARITESSFLLTANKKIVLDWTGSNIDYRAIQMEC
ncbi:MAG: hypothetical protein KatS3mg038_1649 [Candidatus Kapaibacterium sp.]|nr:MAG: hypothetical protein KatS3mg038_0384 [Candidatus Kapabacteria bacterium]GIV51128.1 MAG: hypothetical protein KatS3mg038_1649 [Candidatus Kapabacteria bacterium]